MWPMHQSLWGLSFFQAQARGFEKHLLSTPLYQAQAHSAPCDRKHGLGGSALASSHVCQENETAYADISPFPVGAQCPYLSSRGPGQRPSRFPSR